VFIALLSQGLGESALEEFNQITSHKKSTAVKVNGLTAPRADSVLLGSPTDYGPALAADGTVELGSTTPGKSFVSGSGTGEHWIEFDVGSEIPIVQIDINLPVDHGLPRDLRLEYLEDDGFIAVWRQAELCAALGADIRVGKEAEGTMPEIPWSFTPVSTKVSLYTTQFNAKVFRIRQPAGGGPAPALPQHGGALAASEVEAYTVGTATFKQMAYDDNGNLIRVGPDMGPSRRYRYDSQDRLVGVTDDTDSANPVSMVMSYGPGGRLLRTVDLATPGMPERHRLLWGGQIYAEYSTTGVLLQKYVLGPSIDAKIAQIPGGSSGDIQFTLPDAHGSVHQTVNSAGAIEETKFYSAWGVSLNVAGTALAMNTGASRFGYNGRPSLGNSGLLDFRARFYDPDLGRFLNPDPSGTQDGMNRYAFVQGDPMNRVDRSGLNGEDAEIARRETVLEVKQATGAAETTWVLYKGLMKQLWHHTSSLRAPFVKPVEMAYHTNKTLLWDLPRHLLNSDQFSPLTGAQLGSAAKNSAIDFVPGGRGAVRSHAAYQKGDYAMAAAIGGDAVSEGSKAILALRLLRSPGAKPVPEPIALDFTIAEARSGVSRLRAAAAGPNPVLSGPTPFNYQKGWIKQSGRAVGFTQELTSKPGTACCPTAAAELLAARGLASPGIEQLIQRFGTRGAGTPLESAASGLRGLGHSARVRQVSLDSLALQVRAHGPVLAKIRTSGTTAHAIVVRGARRAGNGSFVFEVTDPARGLNWWVPEARLRAVYLGEVLEVR